MGRPSCEWQKFVGGPVRERAIFVGGPEHIQTSFYSAFVEWSVGEGADRGRLWVTCLRIMLHHIKK